MSAPNSPPAAIEAESPSTVILWVHPRSTSTMFEMALLQKEKEFRVLHEPMGDSFYFSKEKVSNRYNDAQCSEGYPQFLESIFEKNWKEITKKGASRTFSKDMAQYIFPPTYSSIKSVPSLPKKRGDSNPSLIPSHLLLDPSIIHTFLIRTPVKACPSYYRLCQPPASAVTGFHYYDPQEAGYRELRLLFDFLRSEGRDPLIVESEELLKHPVEVMKMWCEEVEIEFNESMLSWSEGSKEHFAKWAGFHSAAENSTGVGKGLKSAELTPGNHSKDKKEKIENPDIVNQAIKDNMEDYEYLRSFVREVSR